MSNSLSDRQLSLSREFNFPAQLIWRAYTEPEHFKQWYAPGGYTVTLESMDVRVGGGTKFTMIAPDGTVYPNYMDYKTVQPVELLNFDHGSFKDDPESFDVVVTLTRTESGGTVVRSEITFPTVEACDGAKKFGAVELGQQTFEKLENVLQGMA